MTDVGKYLYYWNPHGITSQAKYPDLLQLYLGQRQALMKLEIAGTEEMKLQMGATEEILLKYQSSLEDFLTQHLNVLLDLYDLSGRYEPDPPLIHAVKWLERKKGIHSFKLKLFNILGYHSLCKSIISYTEYTGTLSKFHHHHLQYAYGISGGMPQKHPPALAQCQGKRNHPRG